MIPMSVKRRVHVRYLSKFLNTLPQSLTTVDSTRIVIAFFAVSGLDLLDALDSLTEEKRNSIVNWVYSLQVDNEKDLVCGFQGSTLLNTAENRDEPAPYKWGHLANTYSALSILVILGDDLSGVNRSGILKSVRSLQNPNGCFTAAKEGNESDMRFVYCAACICYMLNDWSGMDIEKATQFILNSISYDFGIGQGPELESHGGPTFCAIATLKLLNRLDYLNAVQIEGIKRWLVFRQLDGFQGRPNKPVDTCYSFWIGATLKILGALDLISQKYNNTYIMSTQDTICGGFSKWVDTEADPMHTYLGLGGLSLMHKDSLNELVPTLNITMNAFEKLKILHERWRNM